MKNGTWKESNVMSREQIEDYILNSFGQFTVMDDIGESMVCTNKVWTDESGYTWVSWTIYNQAIAPFGQETYDGDSLMGFIDYLELARAVIHWTIGA